MRSALSKLPSAKSDAVLHGRRPSRSTDAVLDGQKGFFQMEPKELRRGVYACGSVGGVFRQFRDCREELPGIWATGLRIGARCYVDRSLADNPQQAQLDQLLKDAFTGQLDLVVVVSLHRLGRTCAAQAKALQSLASAGVPLVCHIPRFIFGGTHPSVGLAVPPNL